jgi:hypothetical protein
MIFVCPGTRGVPEKISPYVPKFTWDAPESLCSSFLFRNKIKYGKIDYQMGFLKVKSPSSAYQKISFFREAGTKRVKRKGWRSK